MPRDSKGRFTKALVKTKPQLPTDVKLARKLAKIQDTAKTVRATRYLVTLYGFVLLACVGTIAASIATEYYICTVLTTAGMALIVRETNSGIRMHLAAKAKHKRLLKGADSLTNKLLLEDGIVSSSDI